MSSEKKSKTKVFSPNQILLGFFLGSFPAFSYLFYKNAMALGKEKNAKFYVIIGIIATIIYIPLTYYIFDVLFVDTIPNGLDYGLLIGIAIAMSYLAKHLFMDKEAIKASKKYTFQSNWHTFFAGLIGMVIYICFVLLAVTAGDFLGII